MHACGVAEGSPPTSRSGPAPSILAYLAVLGLAFDGPRWRLAGGKGTLKAPTNGHGRRKKSCSRASEAQVCGNRCYSPG